MHRLVASGDGEPGWGVRLTLTLSYARLVMLAGALLLTVVWVFPLRYRLANGPVSAASPIRNRRRTAGR